jgi:hypothetical protein
VTATNGRLGRSYTGNQLTVPDAVAPLEMSASPILPPTTPPAVIDQPNRGDGKLPTDAVVASCWTASRVAPKSMSVENPLTVPLTCQVGGSLPSHCPGKPVGPTGGDTPQACAVCARAMVMIAAIAAARGPPARATCFIARAP